MQIKIMIIASIFIFIIYFLARIIQFQQCRHLFGDSITYILFHNLNLKKKEINPKGVVGANQSNLPNFFFKYSNKIAGQYVDNNSLISYSNFLLLIIIEIILLIYLSSKKMSFEEILIIFGSFSLLPSISWISSSERGSYIKFSERFPALLINGSLGYIIFNFSLSDSYYETLFSIFALLIFSFLSNILGKFSRQVLLICFIGSFFSEQPFLSSLFILIGFTLSLSFKQIRFEIKNHWIYLKNYKRFQNKNFMVSEKLAKKIFYFKFLYENNFLRISTKIIKVSIFGILTMSPACYFLYEYSTETLENLLFIALFFAILISTPFLYFIGSGDRYLFNLISVPVLISSINSTSSYLILALINSLLIFFSILKNYKNLKKLWISQTEKVRSFIYLENFIEEKGPVFFSHYKDSEIFQLHTKKENKLSTTRDYLWDEDSINLFEEYPHVSLSAETLDTFEASYLILKKDIKFDLEDWKISHTYENFCLYKRV